MRIVAILTLLLVVACGGSTTLTKSFVGMELKTNPAHWVSLGRDSNDDNSAYRPTRPGCDQEECPTLWVAKARNSENDSSSLYSITVRDGQIREGEDACAMGGVPFRPARKLKEVSVGGESADYYEGEPCPQYEVSEGRVPAPRRMWLVQGRQYIIVMTPAKNGSGVPNIDAMLTDVKWR